MAKANFFDVKWRFPFYDVEKGFDWEAIEKNFSWFREMKDVPQDAIWHAEGDVQTHTKMVCEALINLPEFNNLLEQDKHIMVTSALLHDVEKRSTTTEDERDGRICIVAPKHAKKGEYTTRMFLYKDCPTPFPIREEICKLVRYHGVPLWKDENLERVVVETSMFTTNYKLAMLAKADVLGRDCEDKEELLEKIEYFKMVAEEFKCLHGPREFETNAARYSYFSKKTFIDYVPYDDSKFLVLMVSGIAGAGKDTYIKKFNITPSYAEGADPFKVISLDDIRRELGVKPTDSKGNGRVIQEATERAKVLMRQGESFIFNATNITKDLRRKWISLFEGYGGKVMLSYIEVPYKTLVEQNAGREHAVPSAIIEKMLDKLEIPTCLESPSVDYVVTSTDAVFDMLQNKFGVKE